MKTLVMLLLGLAALGRVAHADQSLVASLDARRVVTETGGVEKLVPADVARPADVVEYRTTYQNVSKKPLANVAATLPIPAGFVFLAGTATRGALASLDGKTYAAMPLTRRVKGADGREQVVEIPAAEYRFLRWQLGDLPADASRVVVARMRME
ncbi:MAG TPA: hypothetical protein VMF52_16885 [Steroidobacteraceae bacterium]|nr:hypothetical protein [Steroidobacteraceae bacterium]